MMNVFELMNLTLEAMEKKTGEKELENGDQLVSVFQDAVFFMKREDDVLKAELILGEPFVFDRAVLERREEE